MIFKFTFMAKKLNDDRIFTINILRARGSYRTMGDSNEKYHNMSYQMRDTRDELQFMTK